MITFQTTKQTDQPIQLVRGKEVIGYFSPDSTGFLLCCFIGPVDLDSSQMSLITVQLTACNIGIDTQCREYFQSQAG